MRRPLLVLLALSLVANAWLALGSRTRTNTGPASDINAPRAAGSNPATSRAAPASAAPTRATTTPAPGATEPDGPRGFTWKQPANDEDFRQLAADLRAAGFPPRLIATFVRNLYLQEAVRRSPLAEAPFWQRRGIESSKEMQDLYRSTYTKVAPLLGPDGRPSLLLDPITRTRQYGTLPDAKIDAIAAIERDYGDMTSDVFRSIENTGFNSDSFRAQQEQTKLLEAEKLADLAKVLTPAELVEYQRHNSDSARAVARAVSSFDITEAEFNALFDARRAHDAVNPPATSGVVTMEMQTQRLAATNAYYAAARTTLGDDRFYTLLENTDGAYRNLRQTLAQFPGVTPAAAYTAFTLRNELTSAMAAFRNTRPSPEQIQSLYSEINTRLDSALGPDAAKAFRNTPYGRQFTPPTIRPAAPAPAPRT